MRIEQNNKHARKMHKNDFVAPLKKLSLHFIVQVCYKKTVARLKINFIFYNLYFSELFLVSFIDGIIFRDIYCRE